MIVVDTSALLAFLAAEPEAKALAGRMQVEPVLVSAPTWAEAGLVVASKLGLDGVRRLHALAPAKGRNLPLLFKGNDFIHTDIVPALGPV